MRKATDTAPKKLFLVKKESHQVESSAAASPDRLIQGLVDSDIRQFLSAVESARAIYHHRRYRALVVAKTFPKRWRLLFAELFGHEHSDSCSQFPWPERFDFTAPDFHQKLVRRITALERKNVRLAAMLAARETQRSLRIVASRTMAAKQPAAAQPGASA